ncbi:MAG: AAA-like domain-containing protein [Leptolyngbyaceae cyanobacterium MO_188.B28]|nr:AAA-like domain-containing protein [Leptolyngbyaceae cyanobacterium MO_188.B28]
MPSVSCTYQVGGILPPESPIYIQRQADQALYEGLKQGEICYVLSSRQMGKSSLRVRVMQRLQTEGFTCVAVDMSVIGAKDIEPEKWYFGLMDILVSRLNLADSFKLEPWWREHDSLSAAQRFGKFIEDILLKSLPEKIIILIDEIDTLVSLDFGVEDFFAIIRQCYNRRAEDPDYHRLTFALLGVAAPIDLIQDKQRTPFNIGRAIQLENFQLSNVHPLAAGLAAKASKPQAVLKAILSWTGGHPFLTQKVCQLVQSGDSKILEGEEATHIETLVQTSIIDDWSVHDEPMHFRLLQDRILKNQKWVVQLLGLYQIILHQGQLEFNQSKGIRNLLLTGLVINQQGKLKSSNRIYEQIFSWDWTNQELCNHRPYAMPLTDWLKSHRRDDAFLLTGKSLEHALNWAESKQLTNQDYQFLTASQSLDKANIKKQWIQEKTQWRLERKRFKRRQRTIISVTVLMILATVFGGAIWRKVTACAYGRVWNGRECVLKSSSVRVSSGEQALFSDHNPDLEMGAIAFSRAEYAKAEEAFKKARDAAPNAPEARIYLNNAIARKAGETRVIAVAAPVSRYENISKEILRGVADAQTQFNQARRERDEGLIEVVIVDDNNNPETAARIARQLSRNLHLKVLGVIGHASSDVSQQALPEYERAGLAMISSTSGSHLLKGDTFFRTSPSDKATGKKLANYFIDTLNIRNILVVFDSNSSHSWSLGKAFEENFIDNVVDNDDDIVEHTLKLIDLAETNLDIESRLRQNLANPVQAVLLFPSVENISTAITIARYIKTLNSKLSPDEQIKLFGGDTLFSYETLRQGGSAIEGLILAVPWFPIASFEYAEAAEKRWYGPVSWRTASSFDAAQALIHAISRLESEMKDISKTAISKTRKEVITQLRGIKLQPASDLGEPLTSGEQLAFDQTGERQLFNQEENPMNPPFLAHVTRNRGNSSRTSTFVFELLPGQ